MPEKEEDALSLTEGEIKRYVSIKKNLKRTKAFLIIYLTPLTLLGLYVLYLGLKIGFTGYEFYKNATKSEGTVVDVIKKEISSTGRPRYYYYPVIEFKTSSGKVEQITFLNKSYSRYSIGEQVPLWYDYKNPKKYDLQEPEGRSDFLIPSLVVMFFGFMLSSPGGVMFFIYFTHQSKKKFLLNQGKFIYAQITNISFNSSFKPSSTQPLNVIAKWTNSQTQKKYIFKSGNLWFVPAETLGEKVKVYVDSENPKKYYIDLTKSCDANLQNNFN